jgi:hypothetical protein
VGTATPLQQKHISKGITLSTHSNQVSAPIAAVSYTPGVSINFEACNALVKGTLARPKRCAPLKNLLQNTQCSFNGIWQGARTGVTGVTSRNYVLLGAFWYKVSTKPYTHSAPSVLQNGPGSDAHCC